MKQTLNHLDLKQIDQLKEQQMTDKNKKEFNELQTDINSKLMPQMKAYEKSAKKLPAESSKVKHLKQTYLQGVKQKKQKVKDLKTFVDLCNQSVKVNEDILDYTKLFEKNAHSWKKMLIKRTSMVTSKMLKLLRKSRK